MAKGSSKKISVIIPVYNREKTIERALRSVLQQTYSNLEVIVVDDCSTDNSVKVVEDIEDDRVKIVRLKKNSGACHARNVGIKMANGDFVAFQDSDDEWMPDKIDKQILYMDGADINFCAFKRISGRKRTRVPDANFVLPKTSEDMTRIILVENFISTQTILARKEVFENNRFDENLPRFQDWDLVIRLSKVAKFSYCNEPLVSIYVQNDSITRNPKKGWNALNIIWQKYKNYIENSEDIHYSFLRKRCILGLKIGKNMAKSAKEFLRWKFDPKVFAVFIFSIIRFSRKQE